MAVLAHKYAKALLDAALAKGEVDDVAGRMQTLASALETQDLRTFLFNPRAGKDAKLKVLGRLCGDLEGIFGNFLRVVVTRRREGSLREICKIFHTLNLDSRGAVAGVVETALPLAPEVVDQLSRSLANALERKEIILEVRENPALLGGIRVQVAGRLYDASALGRLAEIKRRLLGVPL